MVKGRTKEETESVGIAKASSLILTKKEIQVINKKLRNEKLTQQDSNYLSRYVRPKLREISTIDSLSLLNKLEYNQKARSTEKKIKRIILKNVPRVDSIMLCGSAVQTNYKEYNDIDVIVATKNIIVKSLKKKIKIIKKIEDAGKKEALNLDVQIYAKNSILLQYPHSPSLIYQLKDSKVIYGNLKIPKKIKFSALDLKMKLDWSEGLDNYSQASDIYYAIRNAMLVFMLINKKINNFQLRNNLINLLGYDLINKLRNNLASKTEKKLAINYLNLLTKHLEDELNKQKWEKIELENH